MPPLNSAQRDAVRRFVEATGASEKTAQKVGIYPLAHTYKHTYIHLYTHASPS